MSNRRKIQSNIQQNNLIKQKSTKKIIIITVLSTLGIEFVFFLFGFFLFYKNYEKFSVSASGQSKKINFDYKEAKNEYNYNIIYKNKNILYKGSIGELKYLNNTNSGSIDKKDISFKIDKLYIKKILFVDLIKKNNLLDKNILNYFLSIDLKDNDKNLKYFSLESEAFLKFLILLNKIDENKAKSILSSFQADYDNIINNINSFRDAGKYDILADKLKNTEISIEKKLTEINKNIPDKIYENQGFFSNENVIFVISKLYDDKYYNNIKKVAKIYKIDEKKIVSSIAVEQLRYLSTQRGYAKYLIQTNPYLTTFSKFSYGLGGVKVETAREIQQSVKKYNKEIYDKYFLTDSLKTDEELIEVLKDDFKGFLYTGGLLYSIENRWQKAGYSISNEPGVLTTLYNMGNPEDKIPNANPKVGGSIISVNGQDMFFGEIGFLYYYYINYYIA